jgi:hypothetical protein
MTEQTVSRSEADSQQAADGSNPLPGQAHKLHSADGLRVGAEGRPGCPRRGLPAVLSPEPDAPWLVNRRITARTGALKVGVLDVRLHRGLGVFKSRLGGGIRGKVHGLSRAAVRRLTWALRNTARLQEAGCDWVALTYPAEYPRDGRIVKRHLFAFAEWLRRRGACAAWALEYQSRGAPHFHVLVNRGPTREGQTEWRGTLAKRWYEIVGSGDEKHLRAGTSSSVVKHPERIGSYLASYLRKAGQKEVPQDVTLPGRMWGLIGCRPDVVEVDVAPEDKNRLVRLARRAVRSASSAKRAAERDLRTDVSMAKRVFRVCRTGSERRILAALRNCCGARYRPRDKGFTVTVYGGAAVVREALKRVCEIGGRNDVQPGTLLPA